MVDEEVENILREIRERVKAQELPAQNGAEPGHASSEPGQRSSAEALARFDSHLTVTARSWDRLPPLVSNRSGTLANFELWLKRQLKRATRWFTWEQINFNAAVHHALLDTLEAQRAAQTASERSRAEVRSELEILLAAQASQEQALAEMNAQMNGVIRPQLEALQAAQASFEYLLSKTQGELRHDAKAQLEALQNHLTALRSDFSAELRERHEHILEEQRVCFKQLSLETDEAAVLEDRARRKTEILLDEVNRRLAKLEKQ